MLGTKPGPGTNTDVGDRRASLPLLHAYIEWPLIQNKKSIFFDKYSLVTICKESTIELIKYMGFLAQPSFWNVFWFSPPDCDAL